MHVYFAAGQQILHQVKKQEQKLQTSVEVTMRSPERFVLGWGKSQCPQSSCICGNAEWDDSNASRVGSFMTGQRSKMGSKSSTF